MLSEMTLDLTPAEMVVVTMLASLGEAVMAGDQESIETVSHMLMSNSEMEPVAQTALDKLHAGLKLANTLLKEPTGGLPA